MMLLLLFCRGWSDVQTANVRFSITFLVPFIVIQIDCYLLVLICFKVTAFACAMLNMLFGLLLPVVVVFV